MKNRNELQNYVKFLEDIIESLPVGILVLDKEGKIILTNKMQEKTSRIERNKILGEIFQEKWKGLLSRTELGDCYYNLIREGISYEYVFHDLIPQFFDVRISGIGFGTPLSSGNGFILMHHLSDKIKEDKHSLSLLATNLEKSRTLLQNLVDSSPGAIFTVALDGSIKSSNKTATRIFGYTKIDLMWSPINIVFENKIQLDMLPKENMDSGVEILCQRKNGEIFPGRVQLCNILNEESQLQERLLIITDISKEKNLEERLAISEKLAIYSELIAGIFHQINNPLVGVVNFSSLLLERMDVNDSNRGVVETIYSAAIQCQTLIASLVKGFREPQSTFSKVSLRNILYHSIDKVQELHFNSTGNIRVTKQISDDLPDVMGDFLQLDQVFQNLLDNAFQSMTGRGRLEITAKLERSSREILIQISDTGCGIPGENIAKIFTPFFTTKRNTGGGLGLSFAYQVIKGHAGRIEVQSTVNQGSVFSIFLPCSES